MEFSEIIKEARLKKGMTQQELADRVYVTRQTISKWELGKSVPDEVSLNLLYQCLDIEKTERKLSCVPPSNTIIGRTSSIKIKANDIDVKASFFLPRALPIIKTVAIIVARTTLDEKLHK